MARVRGVRRQEGGLEIRSGRGHDRVDSGGDDGPVSGCVADRGTGSRIVSQGGIGSAEKRGAHRAVRGLVAAGDWIGESAGPGKESMRSGMSVEQIVSSYDAQAPLAEASTIPAAWYVDARIAELERETVFSKTWQVMGRMDQITKPGQFVTAKVAGEPLVAVRGTDGVLRAFYNVCRHHAAAVVTEPCGQASILHCPYHGWNYGFDWELQGKPEVEGGKNFDRKDNGLVPVKVDTWEQFVFVNRDPQAAPLAEFLGGLVKRVAPLGLSKLHYF